MAKSTQPRIEVVQHEEFVVKIGEDKLSLSRDEALKLYNELQTVLAIEIKCEEVEITLDPVCPCIPWYRPYPSPWWGINPSWQPYYDYTPYVICDAGGATTITTTEPITGDTTYNDDVAWSYTNSFDMADFAKTISTKIEEAKQRSPGISFR